MLSLIIINYLDFISHIFLLISSSSSESSSQKFEFHLIMLTLSVMCPNLPHRKQLFLHPTLCSHISCIISFCSRSSPLVGVLNWTFEGNVAFIIDRTSYFATILPELLIGSVTYITTHLKNRLQSNNCSCIWYCLAFNIL